MSKNYIHTEQAKNILISQNSFCFWRNNYHLPDGRVALSVTVHRGACYFSFCNCHTTPLPGIEPTAQDWASQVREVTWNCPVYLQGFRKLAKVPDLFAQHLTVLSLATNHSESDENNSDQFQHDFITLLKLKTALGIWWDAKTNKTVKMKFRSYFSMYFMRSWEFLTFMDYFKGIA